MSNADHTGDDSRDAHRACRCRPRAPLWRAAATAVSRRSDNYDDDDRERIDDADRCCGTRRQQRQRQQCINIIIDIDIIIINIVIVVNGARRFVASCAASVRAQWQVATMIRFSQKPYFKKIVFFLFVVCARVGEQWKESLCDIVLPGIGWVRLLLQPSEK